MYELGIMYEQCGGKKGTMNFYYKVPGLPLELGLRRINNECPDICICDLENQYRGLDLPIEIYVEKWIGDGERQGCEFEGVEERMNCEGQGQGQDNDGIGSVCEGIEEMMNCEGQGEQGHGGDGECQENEMDRGVGGQNSSSEFDDSSDEDYLQSNEASTDSETPSLVLEDLEVSSDEDIFLNKNPSKRDLMHKLRRVMKKRVKKTEKQPEVEVNENWFSDDGENDELESLHGSKLILKKLEGSNPPIFDKMYVCLSALKNGFLSGCRPIIGLDGCFLKTCYGGQLLVAVGRDGNDNMFPIAMAVVQVENRENWTWFLGELLDDIGGLGTSMWSFISDRQKGLIEALKTLCLILNIDFALDISIATKRVQIDEYVDVCYKKSTYLRVYAEMIHAVPGAKDYVQTGYEPLKHPKLKPKGGISYEEILVEGSQIPPASQEHELQSEATRGTKVEQTSVGSSAATHPTSTPPSSNVQTSVGSSAAKHPISTHPSNQEIGYQGPRNDALMGGRSRGSGGNTSRNKTPSISQVLERIKESNLAGNGFNGGLPNSISLMTSLRYLNIENNHFTGWIPEQLKGINLNNLAGNGFNGGLPYSISLMTSLRYLDFSFNSLTDNLPQSFQSLTNVNDMNIENNHFTGWIPEQLKGINLNNLAGNAFTRHSYKCSEARALFLRARYRVGFADRFAWSLLKVKKILEEANNRIQPSGTGHSIKCSEARALSLRARNRVGLSTGWTEFYKKGKKGEEKKMLIAHHFHSYSGDRRHILIFDVLMEFHPLAIIGDVSWRYLQNNQFTGTLDVLANLTLQNLNIENNHFTGWIPEQLKDINRNNLAAMASMVAFPIPYH
ncbi:UNVERIFIED_CONTAM: protein STRUBBELIG-RECEPTOR FAMILY 7 [Sesamum calycinum]|uniref:Protein STRUBBELIG-RECEPTOR FAMILY 7 n=1 Tax=Sesamum calycinum TaxID=2727403 RepID=A0AAW2L761_9LAMI